MQAYKPIVKKVHPWSSYKIPHRPVFGWYYYGVLRSGNTGVYK
jgi:hypothetical protein